jgi:hypothetical protein
VATTYQGIQGGATTEASSECPHIAALVFNILKGGPPEHELNFAELKRNFGLDQGQMESQAQLLVDASAQKRLVRAKNKAKKQAKEAAKAKATFSV